LNHHKVDICILALDVSNTLLWLQLTMQQLKFPLTGWLVDGNFEQANSEIVNFVKFAEFHDSGARPET